MYTFPAGMAERTRRPRMFDTGSDDQLRVESQTNCNSWSQHQHRTKLIVRAGFTNKLEHRESAEPEANWSTS